MWPTRFEKGRLSVRAFAADAPQKASGKIYFCSYLATAKWHAAPAGGAAMPQSEPGNSIF